MHLLVTLISPYTSVPRVKKSGPVNGDECYFWRTTGCAFGSQCYYLHIPAHEGIDLTEGMLRGAKPQKVWPIHQVAIRLLIRLHASSQHDSCVIVYLFVAVMSKQCWLLEWVWFFQFSKYAIVVVLFLTPSRDISLFVSLGVLLGITLPMTIILVAIKQSSKYFCVASFPGSPHTNENISNESWVGNKEAIK